MFSEIDSNSPISALLLPLEISIRILISCSVKSALLIVFFNRLAEIAGEYLKKGSKVYIEGALRTRQWDKEGQKHYSTEIIANEMQMLDGRNDGGMGGGFNQNNQPPNAGGGSSEFGSGGGQGNGSQGGSQDFSAPPPEAFDDDIPF